MINIARSRGFGSIVLLGFIAVLAVFGMDGASAQSAADGAVTALGDVATAGGLIGAAMVAAAAAFLVGRWVTAFIV